MGTVSQQQPIETNMKVTFSRQELMAAMLFASKDDSRYVLNAVCLQYRPDQAPIAIATDGRRLTVIESQAQQEEASEAQEREIVVRSDFITPICALNKALCGKLFPLIAFENKAGSERLQVSFVDGKFFMEANDGALVDGKFPNWKGAIPAKSQKRQPISEVALSAEFIGDYAKVVKILEATSAIIQMNLVGKEQQVEVKLPAVPNFYGIVMQCKLQEGADYQPEFLGIVGGLEPKSDTGAQ
jgi:DNA polymerase III sliding clamp (beta) subunit (PCNA family)